MGGWTFLFHVGGSEDFSVRTEGLIQPLGLPLPRSRRLLRTAVDEPNLGQKPKLGGVRALLPFPLYLPLVRFYLFASFCLFSFVLFVCKNPKRFLLSFAFIKPLKKQKICFLCSLFCFVSEFS